MQLAGLLQTWLEDMEKYFVTHLVLLCLYAHAETLKQLFKKVSNKKISSDSVYYEKSNIFQCFNNCKKVRGCKIFNFNSKKQLCQLAHQNIDRNFENAVKADAWQVS